MSFLLDKAAVIPHFHGAFLKPNYERALFCRCGILDVSRGSRFLEPKQAVTAAAGDGERDDLLTVERKGRHSHLCPVRPFWQSRGRFQIEALRAGRGPKDRQAGADRKSVV